MSFRLLFADMSYYSNAPRSHTPCHIKTGIGVPSIFRSADCIQKAVAQEDHEPVNTSHLSRFKNLQHTHPYTYASLRQAEHSKSITEHLQMEQQQQITADMLNPAVGHTR